MLIHIARDVAGRKPVLTRDQSGALLGFCRSVGATIFTVNFLFVRGEESEALMEQFYERLSAFSVGERVLENVYGKGFRKQQCWALDERSIEFILDETRGDLLIDDSLRLPEDWLFYLGDAILLQVISHEQEATLRLSKTQYAAFEQLGMAHGKGCPPWSGLPDTRGRSNLR